MSYNDKPMIQSIRLQHFRSYSDATFNFGPQVNIIVGPNGSGKTNLLESLLVVAQGASYRVRDSELIQFGANWFRLDAHINAVSVSKRRTLKLKLHPQPQKSYEFDDKTYKRLLPQHTLPIVLFEPNHLQLLHGSPDMRRNYLDTILEQTSPGFASFRRTYKRALSQRNALLKRQRSPTVQELFPWNLRLSELGAAIVRARADLVGRITQNLTDIYKTLAHDTQLVAAVYTPQFSLDHYETMLMQKLENNLATDIVRGFTAYGPHREDLTVYFGTNPACEVASRGETRTAILALKIIELELLTAPTLPPPMLLLDDVFSELDAVRRQALTNYLTRYQTFLTTTDADALGSIHDLQTTTSILLPKRT